MRVLVCAAALLLCLVGTVRCCFESGQAIVTLRELNPDTGNYTSYQAEHSNLLCTEADGVFQKTVINADTVEYYVVTKSAPRYTFDVTAVGMVPTDVYIYEILTCQVDSKSDVNLTYTSLYEPTGSVLGRRLLTVDAGSAWKCAFGGSCDDYNENNNALAITGLQTQVASLEEFKVQQREWDRSQVLLNAKQYAVNTQLQATTTNLNRDVASLSKFAQSQQATNEKMNEHFNTLAQQSQTALQALGNLTAQGFTRLSESVDGKLAVLQNQFINTTQQLTDGINAISANLNGASNQLAADIRSTLRIVDANNRLFANSLAGRNLFVDNIQLYQIWESLLHATSRGLVAMLDPTLPGQQPASSVSDADLTVFIDRHTISFVNLSAVTGGVRTAHQFTLNFYCNVAQLSDRGIVTTHVSDVIDLIGPPNCTQQTNATAVRACNCWFEVAHKSCTAQSSFVWESVFGQPDRSAYLIQSSMCTDAIVSDPVWSNRKFDTESDVHDYIGRMCSSGQVISNTGFLVTSDRVGPILVPANSPAAICDVNMFLIFQKPQSAALNLPFVIYQHWIMGVQLAITEQNYYGANVYGVRPRGLTNTYLPFYTLSNSRAYSCFATAITTFVPSTRIVYSLQPTGVVTDMKMDVYSSPPTCANGVCTGDLLRTRALDSLINVQKFPDGVLPGPGAILVGELVSSGLAEVFDIPQSLLSTSPDARPQMGKVTYCGWPLPAGYKVNSSSVNPPCGNLPDWEAAHPGNRFEHDASISGGYYRRSVSQGQCTTDNSKTANTICGILSSFTVDPTTNMRQGRLVLTPRQYSYVAGISTIQGQSVQSVLAACPQQQLDYDNLLGSRVLVLYNPWSYPVSTLVTRSSTDPTCPAEADFVATIGALDTTRMIVPSCTNYTVHVFRVPANTVANPVACYDPVTAADLTGRVTQTSLALSALINASSVAVSAELDRGTAATMLQTIQLILSVVNNAVPTANISFTGLDLGASVKSSVQGTVNELLNRAAGINFTGINADGEVAKLFAAQQAILANLSDSRAQTESSVVGLNAAIVSYQTQFEASQAASRQLEAVFNQTEALYAIGLKQYQDGFQAMTASRPCKDRGLIDGITCTIVSALELLAVLVPIALVLYLLYYGISKTRASRAASGHPTYQGVDQIVTHDTPAVRGGRFNGDIFQ